MATACRAWPLRACYHMGLQAVTLCRPLLLAAAEAALWRERLV